MISTINSERYGELLYQYQPRIIRTEAENDTFLAVVEELMAHPQLTPEEDTLLELLVKLIEEFEESHYAINLSTPRSRLAHLIDAQSLEHSDLVEVLGSTEVVANLVEGRSDINPSQAEALGKFFHVDPELLLSK